MTVAAPHRVPRILFMSATLAVWVLSLLPAPYLPDLPEVDVSDMIQADKLAHVSSYFVLANPRQLRISHAAQPAAAVRASLRYGRSP